MKTPREILLAQHRAAEPKLDAIRQSALAAVRDHRAGSAQRSQTTATTIFQTLWQELFLPSRRVWSGLAAVWILIFVVNISQRDRSPTVNLASAPPMMSFREQQRWMNELFADRAPVTDAEPPKTSVPKPRTESFQPISV
jgi:hypothetical protein